MKAPAVEGGAVVSDSWDPRKKCGSSMVWWMGEEVLRLVSIWPIWCVVGKDLR